MENFYLFRNGGIAHRRRLQPVSQALIVEQHWTGRLHSRRLVLVPVVNEVGGVHSRLPGGIPSARWRAGGAVLAELLLFRRQRQSKHRNHSLTSHVDLSLTGSGKIQRLAMFAAVDFPIRSPSFFCV